MRLLISLVSLLVLTSCVSPVRKDFRRVFCDMKMCDYQKSEFTGVEYKQIEDVRLGFDYLLKVRGCVVGYSHYVSWKIPLQKEIESLAKELSVKYVLVIVLTTNKYYTLENKDYVFKGIGDWTREVGVYFFAPKDSKDCYKIV